MFKKKDKSKKEITAFEKVFINKKAKPDPVVKIGSIVLCAVVLITAAVCILMTVLDKTGVAPSPLSQGDKNADKAQQIDVSALPADLQKLYKDNFETADFVSSYLEEKDKPRVVSLKKYKAEKQVPLFIQWDKQWGYLPYGDSIAGVNGDGPMCLAMAGYHLTKDEKFSPDKVIAFAQENGYFEQGKGTLASLMKEGAAALGLVSNELKTTKDAVFAALGEGRLVICLVKSGGLSSEEHYIVLRSYDGDKFFINDPTSVVNSEKEWLADEIIPQIKKAYALSV